MIKHLNNLICYITNNNNNNKYENKLDLLICIIIENDKILSFFIIM